MAEGDRLLPMPIVAIILLVVIAIIVIAVVIFLAMRTRKTKAVGGVKNKSGKASKKTVAKKPSIKAVKV